MALISLTTYDFLFIIGAYLYSITYDMIRLVQEGQSSVTGESMCTKYWLTAKEPALGKVRLGQLPVPT